MSPTRPNIVYAATWGQGVYVTIDGGATWHAKNKGLENKVWSYTIQVHPYNDSIAYLGTALGGVYKTVDFGENWFSVNNGLEDLQIRAFAIAPSNSEVLYTGTANGVYRSLNGGSAWEARGLAGLKIWALAIAPNNSNVVYAGVDVGNGGGIYKTDNGGASWRQIAESIGTTTVFALVIDSQNPQIVYAGTLGKGVYQSTDGGGSWVTINRGLGNLAVQSLAQGGTDCRSLFAGTASGIWRYSSN